MSLLSFPRKREFMVIEHLTDYGQVAAVKGFLEQTAHKAGMTWD